MIQSILRCSIKKWEEICC